MNTLKMKRLNYIAIVGSHRIANNKHNIVVYHQLLSANILEAIITFPLNEINSTPSHLYDICDKSLFGSC